MTITSKTVNEIIEEGTDKEVLESFLEFLRTRVEMTVGYVKDEDNVLTHSAIVVRCGKLEGQSAPQRLEVPLMSLEDIADYLDGDEEVPAEKIN